MPEGFISRDFLLRSRWARRLYHEHAARMPIFDYHCHLPARDIAENRRFDSLSQAWLAGDHYKWRAMRACGVAERLITGSATDLEKFEAWAAVVPCHAGQSSLPLDAAGAGPLFRSTVRARAGQRARDPCRVLRAARPG